MNACIVTIHYIYLLYLFTCIDMHLSIIFLNESLNKSSIVPVSEFLGHLKCSIIADDYYIVPKYLTCANLCSIVSAINCLFCLTVQNVDADFIFLMRRNKRDLCE